MTTRSRRRRTRPRIEVLEGRALMTAGALDPTFGAGAGYVTTQLSTNDDQANAVAVQPWDGKVVVAASTNGVSNDNFVLFRYNTDGSLDTTFGTGGRVATDFYGWGDHINAITFTPSHQIVAVGAAGYVSKTYLTSKVGVARYNADGTLDTTFGTGGKVSFDGLTSSNQLSGATASSAAVDPSGNVMVAGVSHSTKPNVAGSPTYYANLLARLTPGGKLDSTFGSGGEVLGTAGNYSSGWSIIRLQPAGASYKIDVVGTDQGQNCVAQFNTNGSRDSTFGSGGKVVLAGGAGSLAFGPDGGFVGVDQVGYQLIPNSNYNPNFRVTRYDASGHIVYEHRIDLTPLLPAGVTRGGISVGSVAVDPSGRVVVAGQVTLIDSAPTTGSDSLLVRLDASGNLDSTFGNGGLVSSDYGSSGDGFTCVVIAPDGSIIAAGFATNGGTSKKDVLVARYQG